MSKGLDDGEENGGDCRLFLVGNPLPLAELVGVTAEGEAFDRGGTDDDDRLADGGGLTTQCRLQKFVRWTEWFIDEENTLDPPDPTEQVEGTEEVVQYATKKEH